MPEIKTLGIVLSSIQYQEYDAIFELYSQELGLIKLISKGAYRPKSSKRILSQPLIYGEFVFFKGKGNIHKLNEAKVFEDHLFLRDDYDKLTFSMELLQTLARYQLPNEPSPYLLPLVLGYLKAMQFAKDPKTLLGSFYLKMLKHDGCLNLKTSCHKCQSKTPQLFFFAGDYYCKKHAPSQSLEVRIEEIVEFFSLVEERSFETLKQKSLSEALLQKIKHLFIELH